MAGWVEMGHFAYPTFSFLDQKKSTTFKITIILHYYTLGDWKKRPNSDRYVVVYCLYCLNTSKQKWNASVSCLLLSPPQPSFGLVTQRHLFPVGERQRCVTRPNNGCESRLYLLPFLKQRENHNYLSTVSCQKNTIPRNFTSKSKLQFCFISNRTKAKTYCDLEWVKKRIILQRRLLDWFLPIWTLPPVCEIRDKMQVVCKELTHDWAKSTIVRS